MRLFLDASVLLAAAASEKGASRQIFEMAPANQWQLITTPYVVNEVVKNLPDFPFVATGKWASLRTQLLVMDDVLTLSLPVDFPAGKDRPVLFGAFAWADVLLTLDRKDFGRLLDSYFYKLLVLKPGVFIERERAAGRLK
ncbi:MAG: PIN domain-containing protein [Chthoniobacteraceae bacterium]